MGTLDPTTAKMKHLLIFMAFGFVHSLDVDNRAPSTYQNCNCQCNSDTWTDGQYIRGNCKSQDKSGALFCYISGSALCACRDIQVSSFLKDNNGRYKYYSYEACTTPERHRCTNYGTGNFGDGDFPYCPTFGGGSSGGQYNPGFGGSGGQYNPGFGGSNSNFGGSNSNYRPPSLISGGSNYRPGSNNNFGGSNYRPGSNNNFGSGNRPIGGGSYPPRGTQTLDDILSGRKTGSSSSSSSSSSSDSSRPSSSAVSFDA